MKDEGEQMPFWGPQAGSMVQTWMQAQQQAISAWSDMLQNVSGSSVPFAGLTEQWQKQVEQNMQAWSGAAPDATGETLSRAFMGQTLMMRSLEYFAEAWKKLAPQVKAGEDWQPTLAEYSEQFHKQFLQGAENLSQMTQNAQTVWQSYLEQMQRLGQPWVGAMREAAGKSPQSSSGHLAMLSNSAYDVYMQSLGSLLDSPGLGVTREFNEKIGEAVNAWQEYLRASTAYRLVIADAWTQAFEQMMRWLVEQAQQGETIGSLRELQREWTQIADDVFVEVFRSEAYLKTQSDLGSAAMQMRIHQRDLLETFLRANDIPTRTEVDEAWYDLYELRKRVKILSKQVAIMQQAMGGKLSQAGDGAAVAQAASISTTPASLMVGGGQGSQPDYEEWTKEDLYERAQEAGIEGRSRMSKEELIEALRNNQG